MKSTTRPNVLRPEGFKPETASQAAKAVGLPSLAVVSTLTGKARSTLNDWHRDQPKLFKVVLEGCKALSVGEVL